MKNINFILKGDKVNIEINPELASLHYCDNIAVATIGELQTKVLSVDCIGEILTVLSYLLKKCCTGNYFLPPSLNNNPGYTWNEYLERRIEAEYDGDPKDKIWIGSGYIFTSSAGNAEKKYTTWLYNDDRGAIVFEITPDYPYHFEDKEDNAYESFIRTYKTIYKGIIDKENAQNVVERANFILHSLQK